jgi:hypothetical protein
MSVITNIVLSIGLQDELRGRLAAVNAFFGNSRGLVSLDDSSLPADWTGGNKRVCAGVSVGAFNGMDLAAFLAHLRSIRWDSPRKVQVFVMEEEDEQFRLINVMEDAG